MCVAAQIESVVALQWRASLLSRNIVRGGQTMTENAQGNTHEQQTVSGSRTDMDAAGSGAADATAVTGTASAGTNDAGVGDAASEYVGVPRSTGTDGSESSTAGAPEAGQNQI